MHHLMLMHVVSTVYIIVVVVVIGRLGAPALKVRRRKVLNVFAEVWYIRKELFKATVLYVALVIGQKWVLHNVQLGSRKSSLIH